MMITLAPITADNWVTCIRLSPTTEQEQRGYVASNVLSLAQAYAEPWWTPLAIYASDTMVGFILHGRWPESGIPVHHDHGIQEAGIDYILRMMIDQQHQGRGYGKAAMKLLIARITSQPGSRAIDLDYDRDNIAAAALYTSLGFRPLLETADGEIFARLSIT